LKVYVKTDVMCVNPKDELEKLMKEKVEECFGE